MTTTTTSTNSHRIIEKIDISHYIINEDDLLNIVIPGDLITSEEGYMNGHGTYRVGDKIYSSLLGTVEITNKLIIVNALKSRYHPQTGDIVVGRVVEIANKRWKVDINASTIAYLSLNNTYLPEQRKKNEEDEFNMRKVIKEGDLIVAEVFCYYYPLLLEIHSTNQDKTYNIHTRTQKYGKLEPGLFIEVPHRLIKRQKHHLITLCEEIGLILANNGYLYLSGYRRSDQVPQGQVPQMPTELNVISNKMHLNIAKIGNLIKVLALEGLEISELVLKELLTFIEGREIQHSEILHSGELKEELLERVRERIPKRIEDITESISKQKGK